MQLLLNLSQIGHTTNIKFTQSKESIAYITLSGCVLEHIVTTSALSNVEKLYYILVNALSIINLQNSRQRSIALPAESWAKRLNCSKSQVFLLQKSISDKGYFIVSKDKNRHNQNKRNLICPTLPDSVFRELCKSNDRVGQGHLNFSPITEAKLQYLDRTKLFIILSYQVLKDISACEYLTPFHKLVWLDFYSRCYKTHMANSGSVADIGLTSLGFSFITSYQQLEDRYSCDKRLLSVALIELEEIGLIKREHFYVKKEFGNQDRQDKSLWKISLLSPEQMSPDSGRGTKPGDTDSVYSNHSASFSTSHNTRATMPSNSNTKDKIFSSTNILPSVVRTLTLEQKNEYYINEVIDELEVQNKDQGYNVNVNEQDHKIQRFSEGDTIRRKVDLGVNEPDLNAHSGVILPIVPEFQSFNIYNNINTITNIYKSNLDVVDNYSNSFINKNNINSSYNKTTECKDRFKNCSSNNMGGGDSAKNENKRVFKRGKFLKRKIHEKSKFNVCTSLIKEKLKLLSKDKADKARKFAYSLFSKNLAKGYATLITKHELAKQFIHHAATWKPTKINDYNGNGANSITEEQQIDIALSVAWNSVVKGTWQEPLEWKKAKALQYEYLEYKKKYQESGVISQDLGSLESMVNNLLVGSSYDLKSALIREVDIETNERKDAKKIEYGKEVERAEEIKENNKIEKIDQIGQLILVKKNNIFIVHDREDSTLSVKGQAIGTKTSQDFFISQDYNLSRTNEDYTSERLNGINDDILGSEQFGPTFFLDNSSVRELTMSLHFYDKVDFNSNIVGEEGTNIPRACDEIKDELPLSSELELYKLSLTQCDIDDSALCNVDNIAGNLEGLWLEGLNDDSTYGNSCFIQGDLCLKPVSEKSEVYAHTPYISKDFVKIDNALNGILKKLIKRN